MVYFHTLNRLELPKTGVLFILCSTRVLQLVPKPSGTRYKARKLT